MGSKNDAWFLDEINSNRTHRNSIDFRQFVLYRICPNCGAKIYPVKDNNILFCPNCNSKTNNKRVGGK